MDMYNNYSKATIDELFSNWKNEGAFENANHSEMNDVNVHNDSVDMVMSDYISLPMPEYIETNNLVTVVKWTDGTRTVVRLPAEQIEQYDLYAAYLAALGKKLYGTTANVHKIVDTHTTTYLNQKRAAEIAERQKQARLTEENAHKRKIRAEIKRLMTQMEAYQELMKHISDYAKENHDGN